MQSGGRNAMGGHSLRPISSPPRYSEIDVFPATGGGGDLAAMARDERILIPDSEGGFVFGIHNAAAHPLAQDEGVWYCAAWRR